MTDRQRRGPGRQRGVGFGRKQADDFAHGGDAAFAQLARGQPGQVAGGVEAAAQALECIGAQFVPALCVIVGHRFTALAEQGQGRFGLAGIEAEAGVEQVVQQFVPALETAARCIGESGARGFGLAGQLVLPGGAQPGAGAGVASFLLGLGGVGARGLGVAAFVGQLRCGGGRGGRRRCAGAALHGHAGAAGEQGKGQQQGGGSQHGRGPGSWRVR